MIGRMKESGKPAKVSRSHAANQRQIKICVPDRPRRPNATQLQKHLAWYVALNSKPSDKKIPHIPQIRWRCPPKFDVSTSWLVAAGEGSQEAEAQKCRETALAEVVTSPLVSVNMGGECGDNSMIPIIPIVPIEEEAAEEMPIHTPAPAVNTSNNSQTPTFPQTRSISGNLTLPQCNPSGSQDTDKSLSDILRGLQSDDVEVAVAAVATVAAIMESKERIHTELLMKFLTDPEMTKKLVKERAKPEHGSSPSAAEAAESKTHIPLQGVKPSPVTQKLAIECSRQGTQTVNQSLPALRSEVEGATSRSAKILSPLPCTNSDPPHPFEKSTMVPSTNSDAPHPFEKSTMVPSTNSDAPHPFERSTMVPSTNSDAPHPFERSTMMPSTNSDAPHPFEKSTMVPSTNSDVPHPFEKSTIEPRGHAPSYTIHHIAEVNPVRPLMPSTLRTDEETIKRLINKYGSPAITGAVPVPSSKPNMEAMKKLINEYGSPNAADGIRPMPLHVPSISRPNVEEMKKTVMGPNAFLPAPTPFMVMPQRPTGTFNFLSSSPVTIPPPPMDLNYHNALIEQKVAKYATWDHNLPQFGQPGNYMMQGLKFGYNTKSIETDAKYQKPCMYFSSSQGCRNGYNCPYQHDAYEQWRMTSETLEVPKRMRFS